MMVTSKTNLNGVPFRLVGSFLFVSVLDIKSFSQ